VVAARRRKRAWIVREPVAKLSNRFGMVAEKNNVWRCLGGNWSIRFNAWMKQDIIWSASSSTKISTSFQRHSALFDKIDQAAGVTTRISTPPAVPLFWLKIIPPKTQSTGPKGLPPRSCPRSVPQVLASAYGTSIRRLGWRALLGREMRRGAKRTQPFCGSGLPGNTAQVAALQQRQDNLLLNEFGVSQPAASATGIGWARPRSWKKDM
jgi:hypothetical protein